MIEALVIAVCGGLIISGLVQLLDACGGPLDLRSDESRAHDYRAKWGRGGKSTFLVVAALILAAAFSYLTILQHFGILR